MNRKLKIFLVPCHKGPDDKATGYNIFHGTEHVGAFITDGSRWDFTTKTSATREVIDRAFTCLEAIENHSLKIEE